MYKLQNTLDLRFSVLSYKISANSLTPISLVTCLGLLLDTMVPF